MPETLACRDELRGRRKQPVLIQNRLDRAHVYPPPEVLGREVLQTRTILLQRDYSGEATGAEPRRRGPTAAVAMVQCQLHDGAGNAAGNSTRVPQSLMSTIRQDDLIESVADALQFISYYHPLDYIRHLRRSLRARTVAGRDGCHRADPDQLAHVRGGTPADLPGHRHRRGLPEDRHGRALGCHA